VLLRVFAVVLGLQVSGVGSAAAQAVHAIAGDKAATPEQCPSDRPCDDCPSSCPNCHCSNGILSLVPQVAMAPMGAFVGMRQPRDRVVSNAPIVPEPAGLFRPPCSSAVS
jgi:hypothetical protein